MKKWKMCSSHFRHGGRMGEQNIYSVKRKPLSRLVTCLKMICLYVLAILLVTSFTTRAMSFQGNGYSLEIPDGAFYYTEGNTNMTGELLTNAQKDGSELLLGYYDIDGRLVYSMKSQRQDGLTAAQSLKEIEGLQSSNYVFNGTQSSSLAGQTAQLLTGTSSKDTDFLCRFYAVDVDGGSLLVFVLYRNSPECLAMMESELGTIMVTPGSSAAGIIGGGGAGGGSSASGGSDKSNSSGNKNNGSTAGDSGNSTAGGNAAAAAPEGETAAAQSGTDTQANAAAGTEAGSGDTSQLATLDTGTLDPAKSAKVAKAKTATSILEKVFLVVGIFATLYLGYCIVAYVRYKRKKKAQLAEQQTEPVQALQEPAKLSQPQQPQVQTAVAEDSVQSQVDVQTEDISKPPTAAELLWQSKVNAKKNRTPVVAVAPAAQTVEPIAPVMADAATSVNETAASLTDASHTETAPVYALEKMQKKKQVVPTVPGIHRTGVEMQADASAFNKNPWVAKQKQKTQSISIADMQKQLKSGNNESNKVYNPLAGQTAQSEAAGRQVQAGNVNQRQSLEEAKQKMKEMQQMTQRWNGDSKEQKKQISINELQQKWQEKEEEKHIIPSKDPVLQAADHLKKQSDFANNDLQEALELDAMELKNSEESMAEAKKKIEQMKQLNNPWVQKQQSRKQKDGLILNIPPTINGNLKKMPGESLMKQAGLEAAGAVGNAVQEILPETPEIMEDNVQEVIAEDMLESVPDMMDKVVPEVIREVVSDTVVDSVQEEVQELVQEETKESLPDFIQEEVMENTQEPVSEKTQETFSNEIQNETQEIPDEIQNSIQDEQAEIEEAVQEKAPESIQNEIEEIVQEEVQNDTEILIQHSVPEIIVNENLQETAKSNISTSDVIVQEGVRQDEQQNDNEEQSFFIPSDKAWHHEEEHKSRTYSVEDGQAIKREMQEKKKVVEKVESGKMWRQETESTHRTIERVTPEEWAERNHDQKNTAAGVYTTRKAETRTPDSSDVLVEQAKNRVKLLEEKKKIGVDKKHGTDYNDKRSEIEKMFAAAFVSVRSRGDTKKSD